MNLPNCYYCGELLASRQLTKTLNLVYCPSVKYNTRPHISYYCDESGHIKSCDKSLIAVATIGNHFFELYGTGKVFYGEDGNILELFIQLDQLTIEEFTRILVISLQSMALL
jgi:hypothetical protein